MTLPTLRLSFLRSSPYLPAIARGLAGKLRGRVVILPDVLGRAELDEVVDALTLLLGLPVYIFAEPTGMEEVVGHGPGGILVLPAPLEHAPDPVRNSIVVCVRGRAGDMSLGLPPELMLLRDAIIECLTRQLEQTRLASIPGWVASVADTPATAMRFVDGVQMRHLLETDADDATLFCAGLAAVVGWMLQPVDPSVAQWVLAMATAPTEPERLVSSDAALLGRTEALTKAFDAGLVYQLPPEDGGAPELRRPLGAISWLGTAPGAPPLAQFVAQLALTVTPAVRPIVTRLARPPVRGLGLAGPIPPAPFLGRIDLLERLSTLLEPSDRVRTCILYGVGGSGRTATAAALALMVEHRLEPVWVHFGEGPEAGWMRVANALGVDTNRGRADRADMPPWVNDVHEQLKQNTYLVIVDAIETVPEWELPGWLPRDTGRCSVLVISRTAQHALQRSHEAIAVQMPPLGVEEARQLLSLKAPQLHQEIARGDADRLIDRLGRHPGPLVLAASLLPVMGAATVMDRISGSEGTQGVVPRLVRDVLEQLRGLDRQVLLALAVGSPSGSVYELVLRVGSVNEGEEGVVDRLVERGLVLREARMLRLHGLTRGGAERILDEDGEVKRNLILRHAEVAEDLIVLADETNDATLRADLYSDLVLAVRRTTQLCASGNAAAFESCVDAAVELSRYPYSSRALNLALTIDAFRAALRVRTREEFPESWALAQSNLGSALTQIPTGNRTENLRQAIDAFRAVLLVYTVEDFPTRWAHTQYNLGLALLELPVGDRSDNLRQAVDAFRLALTVYSYDEFPEQWAMVQSSLGAALTQLPYGDRTENLRQAIDCFRGALSLFVRETHAEDWASIQSNLGAALAQFPLGDRAENLRQAIVAFRSALTVYSFEYFPEEWAKTQVRLGSALMDLPIGDPNERMRQAVEAFRAALSVYTRQDFPIEWAQTQSRLGSGLMELPAGDRGESLGLAIEAFRAALTVLSRKDTPNDWAAAQNNLGLALLSMPIGDRVENLRFATQSFRAALTVYTRETSPQRWALVQRNLAKAYASLPTGEMTDSSTSSSQPSQGAGSSGRGDAPNDR
jgi:tetratricopeptide (TPR) repeat protein